MSSPRLLINHAKFLPLANAATTRLVLASKAAMRAVRRMLAGRVGTVALTFAEPVDGRLGINWLFCEGVLRLPNMPNIRGRRTKSGKILNQNT